MKTPNNKLQEGCGCEKKALAKKVKEKYVKEDTGKTVFHFTPKTVKTIDTFSKLDFSPFLGKPVLFEMNKTPVVGRLGLFKNNYVLYEGTDIKISVDFDKVDKFICEDTKYIAVPKTELNEQFSTIDTKKIIDSVKESFELLTKEALKNKFFVREEVVNADNKGKLTKSRQASRDKIAKKLKNVKVVKGPPGRNDTPEEAKYRLATYIEFQKEKGKKN